jgi:phosphosulfolactate synthase
LPAQFVAIRGHRITLVDDRTLRLDGVGPPLVPRRRMPSFLELPERTDKPRRAGITHVMDRGMSPLSLESLLVTAGEHIDMIKLGWGTAYVSGAVGDKVAICREAGVAVCPGGTLLEIAVHQGRLDQYVEWLHELGIDHVEVSNGSLPLSRSRKGELIAELAREFTVIAEVGSKSDVDAVANDWCEEMLGDLAAGAAMVIAEGRESGTVGLFDASGEVHGELVDAILRAVGQETVIFEAPQRSQQAWLLRRVGPNVNLGNIGAEDVIALETLRRGLRYDTLDLLPAC